MSTRKAGYIMLGLGVFTIIFSLLIDILGFGKSGMGAAQLCVINLGIIFALFGIGLALRKQENKPRIAWLSQFSQFLSLPNIIWIVFGFFAAYLIFLVFPVFFASAQRMVYFNKYLPDRSPIGIDFVSTLLSISNWFKYGSSTIFYPPLVNIVFAPLLLVGYPGNYYIITTATVVSYFILAFLLPFLIVDKEGRSVVLFIFGVSAFSYGLQFELERGQFHTIALMIGILAVYLFHKHPSYRFFAYLLFCVSVQFKIYPALLFVLFVDDWRDWKGNIKRFVVLGIVNFLLLFLLGFSYFSAFTAHISKTFKTPVETWNGNHSINAFVTNLSLDGIGVLGMESLAWVRGHNDLLKNLFLAYFLICFAIIWVNAYRRNTRGIDSILLMACVMGGLLIPTVNHDYTLPLLAAPFILIASEQYSQDNLKKRLATFLLLIISSFTYFITLLPFIYKPEYLQNSFPLLIILLTTSTLLSFLIDKSNKPRANGDLTILD